MEKVFQNIYRNVFLKYPIVIYEIDVCESVPYVAYVCGIHHEYFFAWNNVGLYSFAYTVYFFFIIEINGVWCTFPKMY